SWERALQIAASQIKAAGASRISFFLTARGIMNETYYAIQKVVRFLGTNDVDNAARICHAPSTGALKHGIGYGATTVSYRDVIESDLIVLFGSNVANAQPVFMKYLHLAKKRGAKILVVNPYREPGLERYWVPSNADSLLFGTKMADAWVQVAQGGDIAFISAALLRLEELGALDQAFIAEKSAGWSDLRSALSGRSIDEYLAMSGATRDELETFCALYGGATSAVLIWSMGITQQACGSENVAAIVNLGRWERTPRRSLVDSPSSRDTRSHSPPPTASRLHRRVDARHHSSLTLLSEVRLMCSGVLAGTSWRRCRIPTRLRARSPRFHSACIKTL
ncbi:MAG: hypothetical protein RI971_592, partial [Chloroflexota bacterium]